MEIGLSDSRVASFFVHSNYKADFESFTCLPGAKVEISPEIYEFLKTEETSMFNTGFRCNVFDSNRGENLENYLGFQDQTICAGKVRSILVYVGIKGCNILRIPTGKNEVNILIDRRVDFNGVPRFVVIKYRRIGGKEEVKVDLRTKEYKEEGPVKVLRVV